MKAREIIFFVIIAVMFPLSAVAQVQSPSGATSVSATASSSEVREAEVRGFLGNYVDRYNQKDTDGFLSLFSAEAVQNKSERIGKIRRIYTNFFEQSHELKYQIEEPKIEIFQNGVEVRARYEITQTPRGGGGKRVWKGNGSWFLIKEDGGLRILYLTYQHQKAL
jgi:hypothetical protein